MLTLTIVSVDIVSRTSRPTLEGAPGRCSSEDSLFDDFCAMSLSMAPELRFLARDFNYCFNWL
jgi:hypothetical protein